jgi:asparagine synthase (glutamine-hydrolysing)
MCGIFALCNNTIPHQNVIDSFNNGQNRGPEFSKLMNVSNQITIGFHRLAINGIDSISNQPFFINNVYLICNGEIYNHSSLFDILKIKPTTNSDCEIIIHLYLKYGIEQTLNLIDGVFSFFLIDLNNEHKAFIARDPLGVRPLFIVTNENSNHSDNIIMISSDVKSISPLVSKINSDNITNKYTINQFQPGTYSHLEIPMYPCDSTKIITSNKSYFTLPHSLLLNNPISNHNIDPVSTIHDLFLSSVKKRVNNTDRPIACLLSGGLDSSLVTSLVSSLLPNDKKLETWSIGLEGSEDLKYAKYVSNYLNTDHHEIILTEQDFFNEIPNVIYNIESYDVTTVRASIGNYLVAKNISENSRAKVIFNGDGADELFGGYLYTQNCPNPTEFDQETRRLLNNIAFFDVLRSDKSISSNGLEPRTPFLDKSLVSFYMMLPNEIKFKFHKISGKNIIRSAFDSLHNYLPHDVLWRKKEAFSDGVSKKERSLFQIIQENIRSYYNSQNINTTNISDIQLEKKYYKDIFDNCFPNSSQLIPYYWMPKYSSTEDPSARTIEIYDSAI